MCMCFQVAMASQASQVTWLQMLPTGTLYKTNMYMSTLLNQMPQSPEINITTCMAMHMDNGHVKENKQLKLVDRGRNLYPRLQSVQTAGMSHSSLNKEPSQHGG